MYIMLTHKDRMAGYKIWQQEKVHVVIVQHSIHLELLHDCVLYGHSISLVFELLRYVYIKTWP